jgi:hypothetical protein
MPRRAIVPGAVALAAASLLLPWALAFDPQAWVVWGRDAGRFALDTSGGPSWKPLPVVVTTPLALTGDPTPALWLVVARAGGLLALAGAWTLAARLGGRVAGAAAAAVMAISPWWLFNTALGNSEGLLAAGALWAVVAHLAGRRRAALALGTAAALLRPEVWPFLGGYGLWLWQREPSARAALVASGVVVPLLWLGPDVLGIGGALSASRAARGEPSLGSAALEDVPGLAVLADAVALLTVPATLAAAAATIAGPRLARTSAGSGSSRARAPAGVARALGGAIAGPELARTRRGAGLARALAAAAVAWIVIVAVMAQAGYAGNPRYLVAAMAFGCVLAGAGAAWIGAEIVRRRAGFPAIVPRVRRAVARGAAVAAAVLVAAVLAITAGDLADQVSDVGARADRREALPDMVAAAGGRDAIVGCAPVRTAPDVRPLVAWELDISMHGIDRPPEAPVVVVRWRPHGGGPVEPALPPGDFRLLGRAPYWEAQAACRVSR